MIKTYVTGSGELPDFGLFAVAVGAEELAEDLSRVPSISCCTRALEGLQPRALLDWPLDPASTAGLDALEVHLRRRAPEVLERHVEPHGPRRR